MKKIVSILLAVLILGSYTAYAEMPTFDPAQWEDIFTGASVTSAPNGILLSGKGYTTAPAGKFQFRDKVAYDVTNSSITVKFPATFTGCDYANYPDYTYWLAFTSIAMNWCNAVPSVVFIVRPTSNTKMSIELAGNDGSAWTSTSTAKAPLEITLGADRTLKVALKKTGATTNAIVNGTVYAPLTAASQANVDSFKKNKCYLMFGGTSEKDLKMKYTMQMTITDTTGKLAVVSATTASDATTVATTAAVADTTGGSTAVTSAGDTSTTAAGDTSVSSAAQNSDTTAAVIANSTTNSSGGSGGSNLAVIILIIVILLSSAGMITTYILFKKKEIAALHSENK